MAYWLCQDYGNDPDRYANRLDNRLAALISGRARNYSKAEETFAALKLWEFATPTAPLVYFVDTRTRRGFEDEPHRRDPTAPAFLKTLEAWSATTARLKPLLDRQDPSLPLVLVTAAPVFGFGLIELFQGLLSLFSDYFVDYENWSANEEHFAVFLDLMRGRDVVLLSGDVHYAFTSTARFVIFDSPAIRRSARGGSLTGSIRPLPVGPGATYRPISEARFIQLTSSALKNYAKTILRWLGNASDPGLGTITTADGDTQRGSWENGVFIRQEVAADGSGVEWAVRTLEEVRPSTFFQQKINDALNTGYIEDRNLGVVQFQGRTVRHSFRTPGKSPTPQMTWDFNNQKYWT